MEPSPEIVTWILTVLSLVILPIGFLWRIIRSKNYPTAWKLVFASCDIAHFILALGVVLSLTAPDDQAALTCRMAGFLVLFGCQDAVWSIVVYDIVFLWISFPLKETHSAKSSYQRNVILIILIPQKLFQTVLVILPLTSLEYFDTLTPYLIKCLPFRGIHSNGSAYFLLIAVLLWVSISTALVFLCATFLKIQRARLTRVHSSTDIQNLSRHVRYATIVLRLSILEHIVLFVSCFVLTLTIYSDTFIQQDSSLLCFALGSFVKALISIAFSWYGDNRTSCQKRKPRVVAPIEADRTLRKLEHIGTKHGIVSLKCAWTDAGRPDVQEGLLKVYEPDKLKLWAHEIVVLGMLRSRQFPSLLKCQWTDSSNPYSDTMSLISGENVSSSSRLICVDFMNLGSLSDVLPRLKSPLSDSCLLSLVSDVAEGLSYLHSLSILHNRLYLKNIFIRGTIETQNLSASIGNFEHSEVLSPLLHNDTENGLSDNWLVDPVVVEMDNSETFRFDIRAFGLVILESVILNSLLKKSANSPSVSIFHSTENYETTSKSESAPVTTNARTCDESDSKENNNLPDVLLVKRVVTEYGHNRNEYCINDSNNLDTRHSEGQCNSKSISTSSGSESCDNKTLHEKEQKTSPMNESKPTFNKNTFPESIVRSVIPNVQKHAEIKSKLDDAEDIIKNCEKPKKDYMDTCMVELVSRYPESTSVSHCNTNYTTDLSKAQSKKKGSYKVSPVHKQQSDNNPQREDVDLLALICQDSVAALVDSISDKYPAEVITCFRATKPHAATLTINHQNGVEDSVMNVTNKNINKPLKYQSIWTSNDDQWTVPYVKTHSSNQSSHSFHNGATNSETVQVACAKSKIPSTHHSAFTRVVKPSDAAKPIDSGNKCQVSARENIQTNATVNGSNGLNSEISQNLVRGNLPDVASNVLQGERGDTYSPGDNIICSDVANIVVHDVNSNISTGLDTEILNCGKRTLATSSNNDVVSDTTSSVQNNCLKIPSDLSNRERNLKEQSLKMNRARRQLKAAVKTRTVSRLIKTTRSLERTRNAKSDKPSDKNSSRSQGDARGKNTIDNNHCNKQTTQHITYQSITTLDDQTQTNFSHTLAESCLSTASIELDQGFVYTNGATSNSTRTEKVMKIHDINTEQKCYDVKCISTGNVDFKRKCPLAWSNTHASHNNAKFDTVCSSTNLFQSYNLDGSQAMNIENLAESRMCHFDEIQGKNCENVAESYNDCSDENQVKNDLKHLGSSSYRFGDIQVINGQNRVDSPNYRFGAIQARIDETEDNCKNVNKDQIQAKFHKRGLDSHSPDFHGIQSNIGENSVTPHSKYIHGSQNQNIETGIYFDGIQAQNGANCVESHHDIFCGIQAKIGEQDESHSYCIDETQSRNGEIDVESHSCHFDEIHLRNGDKADQYGRKLHLFRQNNGVRLANQILASSDKCTGITQPASCHAPAHSSGKQLQKIYGKYNSVILDSELIIGRLRGMETSINTETQNKAKYGNPVSPHSQECQTKVSTLYCSQDETEGDISHFLRKRCKKLSSDLIPSQDLLPVTDAGVRRIIDRLADTVDLSTIDEKLLEAFDRCWSFSEPVPSAADISRFLHLI